jgi:hypothetical protein
VIKPSTITILAALLLFLHLHAKAQVENVPADHPIYLFLDRMEARQLIQRYHDAILPLSREEVAGFLSTIAGRDSALSSVERGYLRDYLSEFQFDISRSFEHTRPLINPPDSIDWSITGHLFSDTEKFLFAGSDSTISLFANALLDVDARWITGDALGSTNSQFVQFGGRFRGTAFDHVGYYLEATNAAFRGSRELLQRDRIISQAHTLNVVDTQHFDFAEGYVRYTNDIFSLQIGRERLLWGLGYDQKMIASDNVRVFDFIRLGARYKSFQYIFVHGWLLGESSSVEFTVPGDTTVYVEPTNADKYFAGHRFEISFENALDLGFQEMVIYSNRSPDLAYLNPLIVIESVQRSRGERDNVSWGFDVETHFMKGLQLSGSIIFDDLHLGEFFEPKWYNKYAYQAGLLLTDPLFLPNITLIVEYTRVEPFVYSHERSRESTYSSLGASLGPRIGANADAWFLRLDWFVARRWFVSGSITFERSGENIYDDSGNLVTNVGGDIRQPHRPSDPIDRVFLDGNLVRYTRGQLRISHEIINQIWCDGWYLYELSTNAQQESRDENHTAGFRVRMEF